MMNPANPTLAFGRGMKDDFPDRVEMDGRRGMPSGGQSPDGLQRVFGLNPCDADKMS